MYTYAKIREIKLIFLNQESDRYRCRSHKNTKIWSVKFFIRKVVALVEIEFLVNHFRSSLILWSIFFLSAISSRFYNRIWCFIKKKKKVSLRGEKTFVSTKFHQISIQFEVTRIQKCHVPRKFTATLLPITCQWKYRLLFSRLWSHFSTTCLKKIGYQNLIVQ